MSFQNFKQLLEHKFRLKRKLHTATGREAEIICKVVCEISEQLHCEKRYGEYMQKLSREETLVG